jgi:hypothetical protein
MYRDAPIFVMKSDRRSKIAATHVQSLKFLSNSSSWRIVFQPLESGRRKVKVLYGWVDSG